MWVLNETNERIRASERLHAFVRLLTRARRLQLFVELACASLFWALAVACVAILLIRFGWVAYSARIVLVWLLGLALAVAAVTAWLRRPQDLEVAILADLRLNLAQKLSTAWEFATLQADAPLTERLAAQAIKARLPARPEQVFPLRINTWGKLIPVAAMLLLFVSMVDLQWFGEPPVPVFDERVVGEGVRLREFARRMQARAEREELPRSRAQSQAMQRLGSRMESGALSRNAALSRLQQLAKALDGERLSVLAQGTQTRAEAAPSSAEGSRLRALLQQLLDGELALEEAWALADDSAGLARLGVSAGALEDALEELAQGDPRALRRMLEQHPRLDQAEREAEALREAQVEVERAQENLGETGASNGRAQDFESVPADIDVGPGNANEGRASSRESGGANESFSSSDVSGHNPHAAAPPNAPRSSAETERAGVVLKPQSQLREGPVFSSEARVLPRPGQPTVENVELDARFTTQVEEVLSKEEYPLHDKEFIRRYFINLSEGVPERGGARGD